VYTVKPGDRFGRGTVISEVCFGEGRHRYRAVRLHCDCGNEYEARITDLFKQTSNRTQSCGCLRNERVRAAHQSAEGIARLTAQSRSPKTRAAVIAFNKRSKTTHGLTRTHPLYSTWSGMMNRCYNLKQPAYKNYGARGIAVCERWHNVQDFVADIEAEIGPKPDPKLTLDRIENDGNYEPGNVQWATRRQQMLNRRPDRGSLAARRIAELEAEVAVLRA
jgi:hypothetical protein